MKIKYFICFAIAFSNTALAEPISTTVDGGYSNGKALQCKAYLSVPTKLNSDTPKLFFSVAGTGAYTTYYNHINNVDNMYYLTIDKPGILPDLHNPGKPIIDKAVFDLYTISSLVTCAQNALYWADNYLKNTKSSIILQGHSEGTVVMINLVNNIYADKSKKQLQDNIKGLFLSGVVIQHMSDVIAFQFKGKDRKELMNAYQKHDTDFLLKNYGVGWSWVDEVLHENKAKLVDISTFSKTPETKKLPIQIFQGLLDNDVPTKVVIDFEKSNHAKPKDKQLNLNARYYNAGHELNETALFDIERIRDYYFNKSE